MKKFIPSQFKILFEKNKCSKLKRINVLGDYVNNLKQKLICIRKESQRNKLKKQLKFFEKLEEKHKNNTEMAEEIN